MSVRRSSSSNLIELASSDEASSEASNSSQALSSTETDPTIQSRSTDDIPENLIDYDVQIEDVVDIVEHPFSYSLSPREDVNQIVINTDLANQSDYARSDNDKINLTQAVTSQLQPVAITSTVETTSIKFLDTKDEATMAVSPTADLEVQTSRRPTLDLFQCQYGYHFPTSPTASMISDLAKTVQKSSAAGVSGAQPKGRQVGQGKFKFTLPNEQDEQIKRLKEMFPTAPEPVVEQMIRIYKGREGLIKVALISFGYKRASEYGSQQAPAQSPIMLMMSKPASKKLYEKLVSYFPEKDEDVIKNLMYKHREVEHEIISALVESNLRGEDGDFRHGACKFRHSSPNQRTAEIERKYDRIGIIMKLRYLKHLFPSCDEIELYHLLHCNNMNAQKVMEQVEKGGHKRANIEEVMQTRKLQSQQMRAQQAALVKASSAKDKGTPVDALEAHKKRVKPILGEQRINNLKGSLAKNFPNVPEELLLSSLEAADYNESLASKFLDGMPVIDETFYKKRHKFFHAPESQVVLYPCKSIQKVGEVSFMACTSNEFVAIPRQVVECENALALLKVDASTFTGDDFADAPRHTKAQGRSLNLAMGSSYGQLKLQSLASKKECLNKGAKMDLRKGSKYEQVCADKLRMKPNERASGRSESLAKGCTVTLRCGTNAKLLERIHPFMIKQ